MFQQTFLLWIDCIIDRNNVIYKAVIFWPVRWNYFKHCLGHQELVLFYVCLESPWNKKEVDTNIWDYHYFSASNIKKEMNMARKPEVHENTIYMKILHWFLLNKYWIGEYHSYCTSIFHITLEEKFCYYQAKFRSKRNSIYTLS